MVTGVSLQPYQTTNAAGQFYVQSDGYVQGMAIADPVARFHLATGIFDPAATSLLWGGVGITENIPASTSNGSLGSTIDIATTISATGAAGALTGFVVSDQAYNWITTPQSTAPSAAPGMSVPYYRFGSNARIVVAASPQLVSIDGSPISQQVSWDFTAQMLVPYAPAYPQATVSNATWANTSGGQNTYTVGTDLTSYLAAGDTFETSGIVSTGGNGTGYNGQWVIVSINTTTIVATNVQASSPGTYSSGGHVLAGGGAVPCRGVLQIQATGNKTVVYNSTANTVNYQNSGAVAVILL